MTTNFFGANNVVYTLCLCLSLTACQSEDFYQKVNLDIPVATTLDRPRDGEPTATDGGVDSGSTVGGSTTGGATTGGETGGGIVYENKEEVFTQKAEKLNKLDVLWVVDNSGSMSDEQESLGRNFDAFISEFITKSVDFKMSITTTDDRSGYQGVMVSGSDTKLTSAAAHANVSKFMNDFNSLIKVGTKGSGNEQGLAGAQAFMNKYRNFFRDDAYLAVVIVSDEEDSSPATVESYVDALKGIKVNPGFVKVYSIADINNSNRGSGIKTGSLRYQKASELTSGTKAEIHDDFYETLLGMGEVIISLLDSFALAGTPVNDSLKVYVNDEIVTSGLTYDIQSNSLKFDENSLPKAGSKIRVTYKVVK